MSPIIFRPAANEDQPALLSMMRKLAEQEPGGYSFDEPVVSERFAST